MGDKLRVLRLAAVVAVLVFAGVTLMAHGDAGAPVQFLVLEAGLGLLFVVAGAVAWWRRPAALTGPILTVSGFLWFAGGWAFIGIEPHAGIAYSFERYYDPLLAFLALSFPGRRPASRAGLVLLVTMASAYAVRSAFRLLFVSGAVEEPTLALADSATSLIAFGAALGIALLVARRVVRASPAAARVMRPVGVAGVVAALSAAYDNLEIAYGWTVGESLNTLPEPWAELFSWTLFAFVAMVPLGFLVGTLRSRLRHGALAPLALELDRSADPARLERALAHALGDPSLRLFVRDRDTAEWRDAEGRTTQLPNDGEGRSVTVLEREGEDIAALSHDEALLEDAALVGASTAVLRLAIENERLTADVRRQLEEVRASRARLVEAAHQERARIERDLHDGAQQRLLGVALKIQEATSEARRDRPDADLVRQLDDASEELKGAIDELRELARGIHPALLTEEGLGVAVTALARRSSVPVDLDISVDRRLPPAVEATGYYVVAEGLTNVTRHARARNASVMVRLERDTLRVEVADDGQGGADETRGSGLRGLADRLEAISGRLEIGDNDNGGTRLKALIPCA